MNNARPSYYARPSISHITRKVMPGRFDVFEYRNGNTDFCFSMSNRGDRLQELLKRGIPLDDAKKLFYEMDG